MIGKSVSDISQILINSKRGKISNSLILDYKNKFDHILNNEICYIEDITSNHAGRQQRIERIKTNRHLRYATHNKCECKRCFV